MSDWFADYLIKNIKELEQQEKPGNWFSVKAISDIPYIEYYGLSDIECLEVWQQIQNTLRISRNENQFKEVSITYKLDDDADDKYIVVKGGVESVKVVDELLCRTDRENKLVVVSLHNHPNLSTFSIQDVGLFCGHPCIKLMVVANTKGEISYLLRPKNLQLDKVVPFHLFDVCPDFSQRYEKWQRENVEHKQFKISYIIEDVSMRTTIFNDIIFDLKRRGVLYELYTNKDNHLKPIKSMTENANGFTQSENISFTHYGAGDVIYENGEDGDRWELPV